MRELDRIREIIKKNEVEYAKISSNKELLEEIVNSFLLARHENINEIKMITDSQLNYLFSENIINIDDIMLIKKCRNARNMNIYITDVDFENLYQVFDKITATILKKINDIDMGLFNVNYKELLKKVEHLFINLDLDDVDILYHLIEKEDISDDEKIKLLMYISNTIYERRNYYANSIYEQGMSDSECIELFKKYHYSEEDYHTLTPDNKALLKGKGVYDIVDGILKVLDDKKINLKNNCGNNLLMGKQKNVVLMLVESNPNMVLDTINDFIEYCHLKEDEPINFYWLMIIPGRFSAREKEYKERRKKDGGTSNGKTEPRSNDDFRKNLKYFSEMCYHIYGTKVRFLDRLMDKSNGLLLDQSHEKVLRIVEVLKLYGLREKDFFECASTIFKGKNHAHILDVAIELDCLDYLKQNQSRLGIRTIKRPFEDYLYVAKTKNLFTYSSWTNFGNEHLDNQLQLQLSKIEDYFTSHPDCISVKYEELESVQKQFREIDNIVDNAPFKINEIQDNIESDEYLSVLENNYKENDYLYVVDGIRISRIKVLRVMNTLLDKEVGSSKIAYAIARHSFLTLDEMKRIFNALNDKKGKML